MANGPAPWRRAAVWAVAAAAGLLLAGCRADAQIGIKLNATGDGYVEVAVQLDRQAASQIGDPTQLLKVGDLRTDGWAIRNPEPGANGGLVLRARKNTVGLRQAESALHELTSKGVLDGVRIRRVGRLVKRGFEVRGVVDLTKGVDAFGDERVREVIGGTSLIGLEHNDLVRLLGAPVPEAIHLELVTTLDGHLSRTALPLGMKTMIDLGAAHWYGDVAIPVLLCLLSLGGLLFLWFIDRRDSRFDPTSDMPTDFAPGG